MDVRPALDRVGEFAAFLRDAQSGGADAALWEWLLAAEAIGRPVGAEAWVKDLETRLRLPLTPQKRGRKPR